MFTVDTNGIDKVIFTVCWRFAGCTIMYWARGLDMEWLQ
jgi:hypothetical protein